MTFLPGGSSSDRKRRLEVPSRCYCVEIDVEGRNGESVERADDAHAILGSCEPLARTFKGGSRAGSVTLPNTRGAEISIGVAEPARFAIAPVACGEPSRRVLESPKVGGQLGRFSGLN
jgi:hypothetical protein